MKHGIRLFVIAAIAVTLCVALSAMGSSSDWLCHLSGNNCPFTPTPEATTPTSPPPETEVTPETPTETAETPTGTVAPSGTPASSQTPEQPTRTGTPNGGGSNPSKTPEPGDDGGATKTPMLTVTALPQTGLFDDAPTPRDFWINMGLAAVLLFLIVFLLFRRIERDRKHRYR